MTSTPSCLWLRPPDSPPLALANTRAEDDEGFCEVHVNTIEGFWSLLRAWLRAWLRPQRGSSQELLPLYLGFFEYIHNVRKRGKALRGSLPALPYAWEACGPSQGPRVF